MSRIQQFFSRLPRPGRQVVVLSLSLACGLGAAWLSHQYLQKEREQLAAELLPSGGFREVLVAARPIKAGSELTLERLAVRSLPVAWLPGGTLQPADIEAAQGRLVRRDIRAGEPVLFIDLPQPKPVAEGPRVRAGHRLLQLAGLSSATGVLEIDDRIDLWDTSPNQQTTTAFQATVIAGDETLKTVEQPLAPPPDTAPRLLAQGIRVVSTGRDGKPGGASLGGIVLEVPSSLVATLLESQARGRLSLSVRGEGEPIDSRLVVPRTRTAAGQPKAEILAHDGGAQ